MIKAVLDLFLAWIRETGIDVSDYTVFGEEDELIRRFKEWLTPSELTQLDNQK